MKRDVKTRVYFQWHITDKCNLKCKHCYHEVSCGDLDLSNLKRICDILDTACDGWEMPSEISLTGGEPFTRREDLFELISYMEQKSNIEQINILSNGTLITLDDIHILKKFKRTPHIQVSLDGPRKEIHEAIRDEGSFDKTIETIKLLKANGISVSVMMTISKVNYTYISEMYNLLKELKVDCFSMDRYIPGSLQDFKANCLSKEETKEAYSKFVELSKGKDILPKVRPYRALFCLFNETEDNVYGARCSAGDSLCILPDGTVLPCRRLPISIGNILKDDFYDIWNGSKVLNDLRDKSNLKGKCNSCDSLYNCGGCRAMAYAVHNDYLMEDPHCWKENNEYAP